MRHFLLFAFLFFSACANENQPSPFEHIDDAKVREVLENAIAQSGGWENFQAMDSIFYEKRTVLFDSLGKVESDRAQQHRYQLRPERVMSISWQDAEDEHEIFHSKNLTEKRVNGSPVEADAAALERTAKAATYTLLMPWKLLDPGVELSYRGIVNLPDGSEAHVIGAGYDPGSKSNHSTNDDWMYFFGKNDYAYLACMVDHGDYFALIQNEKKSQAGGLTFNAFRVSYRVDSLRNLLWKRGEFFYENIVVK